MLKVNERPINDAKDKQITELDHKINNEVINAGKEDHIFGGADVSQFGGIIFEGQKMQQQDKLYNLRDPNLVQKEADREFAESLRGTQKDKF